MEIENSAPIADIRARGSIKDSDVQRMRLAFLDEPAMTAADAATILALGEACPIKAASWSTFFVEAICDWIVTQAKPEGYMVTEKVRWLTDRIAPEGRLKSHAEIELIVAILEKARWSPPSLIVLVLDQVRRAVETGSGPLRAGSSVEPGTITVADVGLVRRVLTAFAGESGIAVTQPEAEALLAIDAALRPGRSTPAWTDLLVRAVGNGVLAGLGRAVPQRAETLADDPSCHAMDEIANRARPASGATFDGAVLGTGGGTIWASCRQRSAEERAMARLEHQRLEIVTGEAIAEADGAWLVARLGARAKLSENELSLLAYIKREANGLPKDLGDMVARALLAA